MLTLSFDLSDFQNTADQIARFNRDQLPYALSKTINTALFDARKKIVTETFNDAFTMRNRRFASAAMRVEKASKRKLNGALYDRLNRGSLGLHAKGGIKSPKSGRLAIPTKMVKRTTRGVTRRMRPRALTGKSIRITKSGIFRGEGGKLVRLYTFVKRAKIKKTFNFKQDFETTIIKSIEKNFAPNFHHALRTARR